MLKRLDLDSGVQVLKPACRLACVPFHLSWVAERARASAPALPRSRCDL